MHLSNVVGDLLQRAAAAVLQLPRNDRCWYFHRQLHRQRETLLLRCPVDARFSSGILISPSRCGIDEKGRCCAAAGPGVVGSVEVGEISPTGPPPCWAQIRIQRYRGVTSYPRPPKQGKPPPSSGASMPGGGHIYARPPTLTRRTAGRQTTSDGGMCASCPGRCRVP
jgi:hypothetical protein